MPSFAGSTAIVTGGGSGIGEATARLLAESGANVVVCDLSESEAERVAAEIVMGGGRAIGLGCDVSDEKAVIETVRRAGEIAKTANLLVNAAGVGAQTSLLNTTTVEFLEPLHVNLVGTFLMCREAARSMISSGVSGRILNISSPQAGVGVPLASAYSASKGGVEAFTRSIAIELAPYGITANVLRPGPTWSKMTSNAWSDRRVQKRVSARVPLSRIAGPPEIANAALFLLSDQAGYCTGATLDVDGGYGVDGRI